MLRGQGLARTWGHELLVSQQQWCCYCAGARA